MDKKSKKELRKMVRAAERAAARVALPLAPEELLALFGHLDEELEERSCDHSLGKTTAWLASRGHEPDAVVPWLQEHGGYCDCEVLFNVQDHVEEAMRARAR